MGRVNETSLEMDAGVTVVCRGYVPPRLPEHAVARIAETLAATGAPASARVRITGALCPGGPILLQINTSHPAHGSLRVQLKGPDDQIVEQTAQRLRAAVESAGRAWSPRAWPDPTRAPLSWIGEGRVTRRKLVEVSRCDPVTAAAMLDATDYDAHLFTDTDTGEDAVVFRAGPAGVRLARQHRMRPPSTASALTIHPHPTPTLTESAAVRRLCDHGLPFLFYTDTHTQRGRLAYRRYDGNLGLVAPLGEAAPDARDIVELDRDEALALLSSSDYGRVVFTHDAMPAIRPVNHLLADGQIILRSSVSTELTKFVRSSRETVVAYQADRLDADHHTGWSVVVTGTARPVTDPDRIAEYQQRLRPWVNKAMDTVVAIEPTLVSGIFLVPRTHPEPDVRHTIARNNHARNNKEGR